MLFSTISMKLRLVMPKTNKKKKNRRLEKFIRQLYFLKSCCKSL